MVRIKICGITNLEDALLSIDAGADMIGFVFAPSPRQLTAQKAAKIIAGLPPGIIKVGVFVDSPLAGVTTTLADCGLDMAQLHGSESPDFCRGVGPDRTIKAFRVRDAAVLQEMKSYRVHAFLLDAYHPAKAGGTGRTFDWDIARNARKYGKIILSGGLNPENVAEAIRTAQPWAVDVSSGVEARPGKKDPEKVTAFIKNCRVG